MGIFEPKWGNRLGFLRNVIELMVWVEAAGVGVEELAVAARGKGITVQKIRVTITSIII